MISIYCMGVFFVMSGKTYIYNVLEEDDIMRRLLSNYKLIKIKGSLTILQRQVLVSVLIDKRKKYSNSNMRTEII